MAFTKRFFADYKSYNDTDYHLEIWIDGNTTTASEIILGAGGPVISYDTDDEGRFNTILSSQMQVPIVCEDAAVETFLTDLRDTYQEQQVYVHLYQSTSANEDPLWSGFVLMDLSSKEDVDKPYVATITATDGLSLLKDRDWVGSGAAKPYDANDMYWGPGRFTYWIAQALQKTGIGGASTGAYADAEFRTSVNWYNSGHSAPAQSNDPLYNTKGLMSWTHEEDDNDNFTVMNTYDVLKEMLKTWGCRITYWKHIFWIVQIPEYITTDSGSYANPDNINTRIYSLTGGVLGDRAYLGGTGQTRYQLVTGGTAANPGLQKLSGSKYDYFPVTKSATANYLAFGDMNYYGGFPTAEDSGVIQQTLNDVAQTNGLYLEFPLIFQQDRTGITGYDNYDIRIRFDVMAANTSTGGTTIKYLKQNSPTSYSWVASAPQLIDKPWLMAYGINSPNAIQVNSVFPAGSASAVIPADASFTGPFTFTLKIGFFTASTYPTAVTVWDNLNNTYTYELSDTGISWENVPNPLYTGGVVVVTSQTGIWGWLNGQWAASAAQRPLIGSLLSLNATGGVSFNSALIETVTDEDSTQRENFGDMLWGDSPVATSPSALQVYDGANWNYTDFDGEWGIGTIAGGMKITELLLEEFLFGQASNIQIINTRLVLSEFGKTETDGTYDYMKYVNPIGKIREAHDGDDDIYVFRRGKFNTLMDEWDYEGWIIKDEDPETETTTNVIYGPYGPTEDDIGTASARMLAPNSTSRAISRNSVLTSTSGTISSGATTRINIHAVGETLLPAGAKLALFDRQTNEKYLVELSAPQNDTDVTLTIVSYTFPNDIYSAIITYDGDDLMKQYNTKTRGTVGGMVVTSDSIDGAKSIGRQQIFFRCDGTTLTEANYYVLNGEDHNKSGRFGQTNGSAPSTISTQRAIKSCQFICDGDYKIESGTSVMTGTNGWDVEMHLYKTTPVDGTTGNTAMTLIGKYSISLALDSRTQIDALTDISSEVINAGDIIIPHIIAPVIGASSSFNFRAGITFTLIRV